MKHPVYYYCPVCQNPSSHAGALDRFTLVEEKPDGMLVVDCLDCGSRSESYHRDLRGKVPRKYTQRTATMIAADFALEAEIREFNEDFAGARKSGAVVVSGMREAPGAPANPRHDDGGKTPVPLERIEGVGRRTKHAAQPSDARVQAEDATAGRDPLHGSQEREGAGVPGGMHPSPTTAPGCPPSGGRGGPQARRVGPMTGQPDSSERRAPRPREIQTEMFD